MKRDWDTVRDLLTRLEKEESTEQPLRLGCFPDDSQRDVISYHIELLIEEGLIDGYMSKELGHRPKAFVANRLTWKGHNFLDSIRSDTVWNKIKEILASKSVDLSFDAIKAVAPTALSSVLGVLGLS